jgi:hypothetical protein
MIFRKALPLQREMNKDMKKSPPLEKEKRLRQKKETKRSIIIANARNH